MQKGKGGIRLLVVGFLSVALLGLVAAAGYARPTGELVSLACDAGAIAEERDAAANVVASRLLAQVEFARVDPEELKGVIAQLEEWAEGATPECRRMVIRALINAYSQDPDVIQDPSSILPNPARSFELNFARVGAIYNHPACSSAFRRKDPREVLQEHEAIARGQDPEEVLGRAVACTFAVDEGTKTIKATGEEAWWQAFFREQLSGLWGKFGPFLGREAGGVHPFTLFGDQVCDRLREIAETDEDPAIRAEAAEAYFTPMRTRRVVNGTITTVVVLCPEGKTVLAGGPKGYDVDKGRRFLDPVARLQLAVTGGSAELRTAAAYGTAKALADLEALSEIERVLGTGILTPDGDRALAELLADLRLGGGAFDRERVLDLIAVRGNTPEARLAAALALGLTWEDKAKRGEASSVLGGAITVGALVKFWWSSQVAAPSQGTSIFAERAKAVVAPLARLFANPNEVIANFTVNGRGIIGLADLKPL